MVLKRKQRRYDRLRNRFFRWIGVNPIDDFIYFADDVTKVLESFELFSKHTAIFSGVVAKKLNIKFDGYKDLNESKKLEGKEGMYG